MGGLVAPDGREDERGRDADEADRRNARTAPSSGRSLHVATVRDGLRRRLWGARARGYTGAVPDEATDNGFPSDDNGFPSEEDVDVDALFAALREEVRRSGADPGAPGGAGDRFAARAEAERLWPVSADRPLRLRPGFRGGLGTPAKAVLRKMMRWYVEPLAYDQRAFNAAALRLIDDLERRVAELEAELALLRAAEKR